MSVKQEDKPLINADQLKNIERILASGDRVEIMPTKDGVKIFKVVRRETKA